MKELIIVDLRYIDDFGLIILNIDFYWYVHGTSYFANSGLVLFSVRRDGY